MNREMIRLKFFKLETARRVAILRATLGLSDVAASQVRTHSDENMLLNKVFKQGLHSKLLREMDEE